MKRRRSDFEISRFGSTAVRTYWPDHIVSTYVRRSIQNDLTRSPIVRTPGLSFHTKGFVNKWIFFLLTNPNGCFLRKRFVNKRKITYWQNGFSKKGLAILFASWVRSGIKRMLLPPSPLPSPACCLCHVILNLAFSCRASELAVRTYGLVAWGTLRNWCTSSCFITFAGRA